MSPFLGLLGGVGVAARRKGESSDLSFVAKVFSFFEGLKILHNGPEGQGNGPGWIVFVAGSGFPS